jgi:hypothetical protein
MLGLRLAFATVGLLFTGLHSYPGGADKGLLEFIPTCFRSTVNHVGAYDILYTNVRTTRVNEVYIHVPHICAIKPSLLFYHIHIQ